MSTWHPGKPLVPHLHSSFYINHPILLNMGFTSSTLVYVSFAPLYFHSATSCTKIWTQHSLFLSFRPFSNHIVHESRYSSPCHLKYIKIDTCDVYRQSKSIKNHEKNVWYRGSVKFFLEWISFNDFKKNILMSLFLRSIIKNSVLQVAFFLYEVY